MQSSIKKFLQKVEKLEGPTNNKAKGDPKQTDPKGPTILSINGASTKPGLATLRSTLSKKSSPVQGPLLKGGGKISKGSTRDSKGLRSGCCLWAAFLDIRTLRTREGKVRTRLGWRIRGEDGQKDKERRNRRGRKFILGGC